MPIIRAQVQLSAASGLPEDWATNTLHFDANDLGVATIDNIVDLLEDLYFNELDATPLTAWVASDLAGGDYRILLYNLDDLEPRAPLRTVSGSYTPGGADGLPAEVALVASFEALPVSGLPQARRRGRIYLPWIITGANIDGRPSASIVDGVAAAMEEFWNAAEASIDVEWVVYSPTNVGAVGVARGWVDNAWDTQRRRGVAPTGRKTWPA